MLRTKLKPWSGSWQEWGTLAVLWLALGISVGSIEKAQWVPTHLPLLSVLAWAILAGWILGKSRLPAQRAHLLALLLGAAITVWQASAMFASHGLASRIGQLGTALKYWLQSLSAAQPAQGAAHFVVFLILLAWLMGYISTWFILRKRNPWLAVCLGAIALLVNLSNLPEQHFTVFFFYALASLLLVGVTNLAKNYDWFKKQNVAYPNRSTVSSMTSLLVLSGLVVSIGWLTPEMRAERFETWISSSLSKSVQKQFDNFFAAIPAKQPILKSDEKSALFFGDSSFDRGDQLQFVVFSRQPLYLRARMYDSYNSSGWTSSNATEHAHKQVPLSSGTGELAKLSQISYTVVPKLKTDILLTGGEFVSSSIPVTVQTLAPVSFNIDLTRRIQDSSLPPDVASLAQTLRAAQAFNVPVSPDKLLPPDMALSGFTVSQGVQSEAQPTPDSAPPVSHVSGVRVTRTGQANRDAVTISTIYSLKPDRQYSVTAGISAASPEDLSRTDGVYPTSVTDYYLQLPPNFSERVRQLSELVTKQAKTKYDKAIAIKEYLSHIEYKLETVAPPARADGVDYFLFTQKSGNCVQFASAMAVMLRSVGIPSRVLSGYTPGELDASTGAYTLTAKERHAWPEVYFSGYGWVGFEATPGIGTQPGLTAGIDDAGMSSASSQSADDLMPDDIGGGSLGIGSLGTTAGKRLGMTLLYSTGGIIILAIVAAFVISRRRRLTRPDYASEVYRQMCFFASLVGLSPRPQQTPLEYGRRLAAVFPPQAEAFGNIAQTYTESRYSAQKELGRWQGWRLRQSWREARRRLIRKRVGLR